MNVLEESAAYNEELFLNNRIFKLKRGDGISSLSFSPSADASHLIIEITEGKKRITFSLPQEYIELLIRYLGGDDV
jgi:hypothetical protein